MSEKTFWSQVKKYRKEIWMVLLVILLIAFMVGNAHDVRFNLVFVDITAPLIVLILGFAALGAVIVGLYWFINNRDRKREIRERDKEILLLKERIRELEKSTAMGGRM